MTWVTHSMSLGLCVFTQERVREHVKGIIKSQWDGCFIPSDSQHRADTRQGLVFPPHLVASVLCTPDDPRARSPGMVLWFCYDLL